MLIHHFREKWEKEKKNKNQKKILWLNIHSHSKITILQMLIYFNIDYKYI